MAYLFSAGYRGHTISLIGLLGDSNLVTTVIISSIMVHLNMHIMSNRKHFQSFRPLINDTNNLLVCLSYLSCCEHRFNPIISGRAICRYHQTNERYKAHLVHWFCNGGHCPISTCSGKAPGS